MSKINEPSYKILRKDSHIEFRQYSPMVIAEVSMQGTKTEAIKNGFRILAAYIFGDNQSDQKIAMTKPVMQTKQNANTWLIRFVMPSSWTMGDIPAPKNNKIKIIETHEQSMISIRFSGAITDMNIDRHLNKLKRYIDEKGIRVDGNPIYAFYNPPWTLPFMRRNEIIFKLEA